jgi:DNA-binding transcriptional regulator YiaG
MIDINELLKGERTEITSINREADAELVKQFRKKHNMTQAHLAFVMGVTKKTVEKWESGTNKVNGSSAILINLLDYKPALIHDICNIRHYKAGEKSNAPTFALKDK